MGGAKNVTSPLSAAFSFGNPFGSSSGNIVGSLKGKKLSMPQLPDMTDSYLKELARLGIQRQLLRSSGRYGAFKGFNENG
jgi:hypothetical protein